MRTEAIAKIGTWIGVIIVVVMAVSLGLAVSEFVKYAMGNWFK